MSVLDAAEVDAPCLSAAGTEAITHLMAPFLQLLAHPKATELCINRPGEVFLEAGPEWIKLDVAQATLQNLKGLATAIATYTAQGVNKTRPLLSAALPSGERVQVVLPPAVEEGTISITVRKPSTRIYTLADFQTQGLFARVRRDGDDDAAVERELLRLKEERDFEAFLRMAVKERLTIVVSGATGSGKTTFMKGLVQEVPTNERLITIEDARELFLPSHPNRVHLLYSKGAQGVAKVDSKDLLHACMRMRPDRIFLSELRGADAFDFIDVAASGHPGSITSTHGGSTADAFQRLMRMIRQSPDGAGMRTEDIKLMLHRAIDVLVQFNRDAGGRYISDIHYDPALRRAADAQFLKVV